MARLATGIEGFDAMVQGGLPAGSSVVLQGPPGQEKLRFALTFLAEGLKAGGSGLVVSSSQSPDAVLAELRNLGVDLDAVTNDHRLRIVDWYSWSEETVIDIEERGLVIRSSIDLTNLGVALSRSIASLPTKGSPRAVIEMLSPAMNVYELTQVYAFAQSAKKKFDRFGFTSLVLLEKDMHSGPEITTLHQPFDGAIEVERTRTGDRIVRKIGVLHLKDTAADPTFRILELTESGMSVVREAAKPAASGASVVPGAGAVLESQEERARRLTLIMQIAGERLKLNPRDADALFAMAAAQATLDDPRGGLQSLDRLVELDPNYPGLWVLKTKLHARLGEADRARQSRLRAQQAEAPDTSLSDSTVPCPMCDTPVAADATVCGNCGVKFAPTRKLEDELEDLGHAAVQEMVEAELQEGVAPPARKRSAAPPVPPPKPDLPPSKPPPKKGLTNGLVLSRGAGRRTGMTNGLKGRTNGLRGRTNGLTNGIGRTNGLTNGVGRTNGLTNGVGRTNGLTNGLGRTNGLTNGLGRTNGLTNGLGRTNGLTNGLGGGRPMGFRSTGVRGMMRTAGWKLYVIPLVVVGLLLVPLFFVPEYHGPVGPIQIDGAFGDWTSVATEAMASGTILNPNVDVVRFGIVENLGPFAFYVQVAGSVLQGGGPSPGTMDSVWIFVDSDGSATTGYRVDGLGADRLIEVSGYAGTIRSATLWEFDANRNTRDWGGWIKGTGTPAAASGSQIEAEAEWLAPSGPGLPVVATVHTTSWSGQTDMGDFPISPSEGSLSIVADPQVPDTVSGNSVPLLRLAITGHGKAVSIDSLHVQIAGTAAPTAALVLRLMDGPTVLDQVTPTTREVGFSFPAMSIGVGSPANLSVVGDFTATGGETFGIRLPSAHPFGLAAGAVGLRENPGLRTLGYLGSSPTTPQVDGGFDEWSTVQTDPPNDVSPQANPNIDLLHEGAQASGGSTFLYTDVSGRILRGTSIPEVPRPTPVQGPPNTADTDRDTVPDTIDPMPLDFNNDGTPDTQTSGDYDGDLVIDYGFAGGSDYWLNTTLPASFPPPFAGLPVSVYIGPTERPTALGEDVFRLFLDIDNRSVSGYSIGGIGADRLVELRGKDGGVTQSALLAFSGSFPGEWAWSAVSPVTVALSARAVELSVSLSVANVYVESGDFWSSVDSSVAMPALAPGLSSFKVSAANQPLSVPWIQVGPQPLDTPIDGSSQSVTTVYNHQRKVVRAGNTPGTACDATNSDGCWYAVFYDQFLEVTSTAPSTETITTGTSCGGAFPTDIQTSNNVYKCYREAAGPVFQAISAIAASSGADVTVTLPAHATNDILLLLGWVRDVDDTVTVSGWTAITGTPFDRGTTSRYWMFWKRAASSSETNPVFAKSTATGDTYAAVITYRGAITSGNPWEVVGATSTGTADPASITGITTLTNNALVVIPVGGENNNNAGITTTGTNPSAYFEHYLESSTSGNGAITFSEAPRATAGATGTISVGWDTGVPVGWGGKALSLAPPVTANYQLNVQYDFTGIPAGTTYTLRVEGFHTSGEDFLVQVVDSTETTWTTRMTITKTSDDNTDQTYTLTTDEYDTGTPNIRFMGATESSDTTQNDLSIDRAIIDTTNLWDRIVIMRSNDVSGSTWGSQVILASGRSADAPLLYAFDSAEPSIAMDASGYLHLVWVSASVSGDQTTLDRVRYAKTIVAYPTQSQLATAANWALQTSYYPTVETATVGTNCGGTFPTDLQSSNNAYLCYREAAGPVFQAISAIASSTGGNVTVTLPVHATNDILLLLGWVRDVDDTVTVSGWTAITGTPFDRGTTSRYWMFWKRAASSSETNPVFAKSTATGDTYAAVITYRGAITSGNPWEVVGATSTGTADPASITGITTLTNNALVVIPVGGENNNNAGITTTGTTPSAYAEHYLDSNTGANGAITFSEALRATAGATGTISVDWDVGAPVGWGGKALSLAPPATANYQLSVQHDWTGIQTDGNSYDVCVEAYVASAGGESMLVQVLTPPSTWNTRITVSKTSDNNADQCYTLTSTEFNVGAPSIRWVGGTETSDTTQSDLNIDQERVIESATSEAVDAASTGFMPTVSTDSSNNPHFAWSGSKTSGTVYYKNKATSVWRATVSWGTTYTGLSVDVSPQNNYVSLARYYEAATNEIQYTVCKNLAASQCDASSEFTKWDGTAGYDTVATAVESGSYPSLATTWDANGDLWVAYAKDVTGGQRAIYSRFLDYPASGWAAAETVDSLAGTIFTKPSIGIDRSNNVHALYVATSGPQLYYKARTGGTWGARNAVGTTSDNPTLMVRSPNDATYGNSPGGLFWKTSTSETYFYIPEFDSAILPVLGVLVLGLIYRRKVRSRRAASPHQAKSLGLANELALDGT